MKKFKVHHLWLILAAYGVWFAIFSGFQEISQGKYEKAIASLILGTITYIVIEQRLKN